jgi:DNA-binding transcriptional MerR regulator
MVVNNGTENQESDINEELPGDGQKTPSFNMDGVTREDLLKWFSPETIPASVEEFKQQILETAKSVGMDEDDPAFGQALAQMRLDLLIRLMPLIFDKVFFNWLEAVREVKEEQKEWLDEVKEEIMAYQEAGVMGMRSAIARAVEELVKDAERQKSRQFFSSLMPASGVLLATLGLGVGLGWGVARSLQNAPQSSSVSMVQFPRQK